MLGGKECRWWYVVSGDEAKLITLEDEWETIQKQLGWKILPCLTFADPLLPADDRSSSTALDTTAIASLSLSPAKQPTTTADATHK